MGFKPGQQASFNSGQTFYEDYSTTNAYVERDFGHPANEVSFINDNAEYDSDDECTPVKKGKCFGKRFESHDGTL